MHTATRALLRERILTAIPLLAVMVMIFYFSAQNAAHSSAQSTGITSMILRIVVKGYRDMPAEEQAALLHHAGTVVRKLAHFTEFFLLGFFLRLHLCTCLLKRPFSVSAILGVCYAASDELHQLFVPGRSCQIKDIAIDSVGILCGILILTAIMRIRTHKKGKASAE